jgi:UDP-2,3-diacylglucosamine pyrophosphatase LpxH
MHVGAGPLDDCDAEIEKGLVGFLTVLSQSDIPTELVVNGDFLDFAQASPWRGTDLESETSSGIPLAFTESQSLEKFNSIVTAHLPVFVALREFLRAKNNHKLVILPGNHDVDFFWDRVRQRFGEIVSSGSDSKRLTFHLQQVYRPPNFPGVWIEHGHQYDKSNRFYLADKPCWSEAGKPILRDRYGIDRLLECVGTRFLIRFLNRLDKDYPFVDNVKPFSKFVRMFLASSILPRFGPFKALVAYWGLLRFVGLSVAKSPADLMGVQDDDFTLRLRSLSQNQMQRLDAALNENQFATHGMPLDFYLKDNSRAETILDFLSMHPELLDGLDDDDSSYMSTADERYMTLARGFFVNETLELKKAATKILSRDDVSAVIMGHTHEPVSASSELAYVNIGCWTRYFQLALEDPVVTSWSLLKKSAYEYFPYEFGYAQAIMDGPNIRLTREIHKP